MLGDGGLLTGASLEVQRLLHFRPKLRRREFGLRALLPKGPASADLRERPGLAGAVRYRSIALQQSRGAVRYMFSVIFEVQRSRHSPRRATDLQAQGCRYAKTGTRKGEGLATFPERRIGLSLERRQTQIIGSRPQMTHCVYDCAQYRRQ
jgi:hypothetical protein